MQSERKAINDEALAKYKALDAANDSPFDGSPSHSNDNSVRVGFMFDDGTGLQPDWSNFYDVKPSKDNIAEKTIQNIINRAPTPALTDDGSSSSDADSIQTILEEEDLDPHWD